MLIPPKEPIIVIDNQLAMNDRTGVIHMPQTIKTPTIQELIADTTTYIMINVNSTPWRINSTGIYGSNPAFQWQWN